jgi:hypothetical protein
MPSVHLTGSAVDTCQRTTRACVLLRFWPSRAHRTLTMLRCRKRNSPGVPCSHRVVRQSQSRSGHKRWTEQDARRAFSPPPCPCGCASQVKVASNSDTGCNREGDCRGCCWCSGRSPGLYAPATASTGRLSNCKAMLVWSVGPTIIRDVVLGQPVVNRSRSSTPPV